MQTICCQGVTAVSSEGLADKNSGPLFILVVGARHMDYVQIEIEPFSLVAQPPVFP